MTLSKDRIIDRIYKNTDLMKSEAAQTFQSLTEIMKQTLSSGENILISGFGKFCVKEKKEREVEIPLFIFTSTCTSFFLYAAQIVFCW